MDVVTRKRPFRKNIAVENDAVVVSFGKGNTQLIKLIPGQITQNRFGALRHDDVIDRPYGSRIITSRGHVYILALDPVLWANVLPHRTQIIYTPDSSLIIGRLDLVPGRRVLEAGTGSGALTHALAQAVWPNGHVRTFDFHQERVRTATLEMKDHGLEDVVSVAYRDILTDGFPFCGSEQNPDGVHAIMIDLPEPWAVISKLSLCFEKNVEDSLALHSTGRVCIFSPCIEQVQKTCDSLRFNRFCDIEVLECVQRTYDFVHTVMNVPNLGQLNAGKLIHGTFAVDDDNPAKKDDEENKSDNHLLSRSEKCLFPPPDRYVSAKSAKQTDSKSSLHADGSWEAYPKPKDTGHTGYLTFASKVPTIPKIPDGSAGDLLSKA